MKKISEDHKEIASGKRKDDEGYMARNEMDTIERSINKLRKVIKKGDAQLPAWVQSKITKAADYIDTAAEYLQSDESVDESISPTINVSKHKELRRKEKIRGLVNSPNPNEASVAKKKLGSTTELPKIKKEEVTLVQKILGEEKCGKGMYWCNTDKVCKPLPDGFKVDGQKKKPTEVGIGKPVGEEKSCNHTKKGKSCPVHGMSDCSMTEEKDPKGPVQSYKSPKEIAKKHGVSLDLIKKQLEMGIKVEGEHTSDKTAARITALQHLDEVPDYYTKLKKIEKKSTKSESVTIEDMFGNTFVEFIDLIKPDPLKIDESVRIPAQNGQLMAIIFTWRGKTYSLKMFFPQTKLPSRKDVEFELQKLYPGARVLQSNITDLKQNGEAIIQIQNSHSKNYLLNNGTIGEDWQSVNRKDNTDGLSQKAVNAYRKENPGSKLKTAVTKDPSDIKKGSKDDKRRKSFCSRMSGMKKRLTSSETAKDPDSRINKALRRWNCN